MAAALGRVVGTAEGCEVWLVCRVLTAACAIIATHLLNLAQGHTRGLDSTVQATGTGEKKHEQLVGRQADSFDHAFRGQKELGT